MIGQGDLSPVKIGDCLRHSDTVQDLFGIFPVQGQYSGGTPVIKVIHVVDQCIKIPILFQIEIIGEKFFIKNIRFSQCIDLSNLPLAMHDLIADGFFLSLHLAASSLTGVILSCFFSANKEESSFENPKLLSPFIPDLPSLF